MEWLPELLPASDYANAEQHEEAAYRVFLDDFVRSTPYFKGLPVHLPTGPDPANGRHRAFHHTLRRQVGKTELDRAYDPERCARVRWLRALLEYQGGPDVVCYLQADGRAVLTLANFTYKVVVERRRDYSLLWTAFPVSGRKSQQEQAKYEHALKC